MSEPTQRRGAPDGRPGVSPRHIAQCGSAAAPNRRRIGANGGNNQQWSLGSLGADRQQIVHRGTGTALDGSGSTTVGSTAVMWTPKSSTDNEWAVTAV